MKICPSCQKAIEDDSFFCEFCGNQLESYSAFSTASLKNAATTKKKRGKGAIIVLSILLSLALCAGGYLGYIYYYSNLQLSEAQDEIDRIQKDYQTVKSDRDTYKDLYDETNSLYVKASQENRTLQSELSTFDLLQETIESVNPTNSYGGFQSRIIAIQEGETRKITVPYTYNGYIWGWTNEYGYSFSWVETNTYGERYFKITGKNAGIYTLVINHSSESSDGGIQTVIYVYE